MVMRGIGGSAMQVFTFGEDENEVVHCRGPQAVIPSPELRAYIMHNSIHTGSFVEIVILVRLSGLIRRSGCM
jgi:hypothetical protein